MIFTYDKYKEIHIIAKKKVFKIKKVNVTSNKSKAMLLLPHLDNIYSLLLLKIEIGQEEGECCI